MIKRGVGRLTLTGTSILDWSVQSGGLTSAAERFRGNVSITKGSTFTFDQTTDANYTNVFSGVGDFNKTGTALLQLSGDSSAFTGVSTVLDGTLSVNGSLGGSLRVLNGTRLQGSGIVGITTIASGGTVAPGNSIGTLNVAGDLTLESGSMYAFEINNISLSDLIKVNGVAILNGGTVAVTRVNGVYLPNVHHSWRTSLLRIHARFGESDR